MSEDNEVTGGELRKQLTKALAENKAQAEAYSALQSEVRNMKLSSVLGSRGIDPKVAALVPADIVGDDAITSWLDDNAGLFATSGEVQETVPSDQGTVVEPAGSGNLQALQQGGVSPDAALDFEQRIANASGAEEVNAIISEAASFYNT
jgi:hypothetical protein